MAARGGGYVRIPRRLKCQKQVLATIFDHISTALAPSVSFERAKMYRALAILLLVFVGTVVSTMRMRCAHGDWQYDRCVCEDDFVGQRCERKKHCSNFMRYSNGT